MHLRVLSRSLILRVRKACRTSSVSCGHVVRTVERIVLAPLDWTSCALELLGSAEGAERSGQMGEGRMGGLWAPQTRALTVGLVLTVTFVASEALAVVTVIPVGARCLGGLRLYGWGFRAVMLGRVGGIVAAGRGADRRGASPPLLCGPFPLRS